MRRKSITLPGGALGSAVARPMPVVGITTEQYPTPAARPSNSILLTRPASATLVQEPFDWQRGLDRMLARLQ